MDIYIYIENKMFTIRVYSHERRHEWLCPVLHCNTDENQKIHGKPLPTNCYKVYVDEA